MLSYNYPSQSETAVFRLPEWTPAADDGKAYPFLSHWIIQYQTGTGSGEFTVSSSAKSFSVELHRNIPSSVLAYPVTFHGNNKTAFFYPAGAVYPYSDNLTWKDGFTADILASIYAGSSDKEETETFVSYFNWQRFSETINQKEKDTVQLFYNPWLLDKNGILEAISSHSFTVYKLNLSDSVLSVSIETLFNAAGNTNAVFLSRYIPENSRENLLNGYSVRQSEITPSYLLYDTDAAAAVTVSASGKISLAISPLPL